MSENVMIGSEEKEQSAVNECATNLSDGHNGGMFPCLVRERVCLRKKENCGKGDAQ